MFFGKFTKSQISRGHPKLVDLLNINFGVTAKRFFVNFRYFYANLVYLNHLEVLEPSNIVIIRKNTGEMTKNCTKCGGHLSYEFANFIKIFDHINYL